MSKKQLYSILGVATAALVLFGIIAFSLNFKAKKNPVIENSSNSQSANNSKIIHVPDLQGKTSLPKFKNFEALMTTLKASGAIYDGKTNSAQGRVNYSQGAPTTAVAESKAANDSIATTGTQDVSATNVQVEGIDEGDILKTDGKYIYALTAQNILKIIHPVPANDMKIIATITIETNEQITDLYVKNGKVVLIGNKYEQTNSSGGGIEPAIAAVDGAMSKSSYYYGGIAKAFVKVYDCSTITSPTLYRNIEVEGNIVSSREKDNKIYLITNKWLSGITTDTAKPENILPKYSDAANNIKDKMVLAQDISYCPENNSANFMLVSVLGMNDKNPVKVETVFGSGSNLYMSNNNLYITYPWYNYNISVSSTATTATTTATSSNGSTIILKFAVTGDGVSYQAAGEVPGNILNQYSLDEFEDNLRIATTSFRDNRSDNNLYVLGSDLKIRGLIEGLAKGERIYSVRFTGKTGYVVTFKNMDPLFVMDLSNPDKPLVSGELKIPGFSNYLHPVGEGRLLGIGRDTAETYVRNGDGKEIVQGNIQGGIKLSLFDVSDPKNPKEIDKLTLGGQGSYSELLNNHKALTYNKDKGLMFFPVSLMGADGSYTYDGYASMQGAVGIKIERDKISVKGKISEDANKQAPFYRESRLCYIGDNLYFSFHGSLISYNMDSLNRLEELNIA